MATVDIVFLIPYLRLKIGDLDAANYRYIDAWLTQALILGVRALSRYWQGKYEVTDAGLVSRSTNTLLFTTDESVAVIEQKDQYPIILMSAIILLEGSLENSSYNAVSWKDAEISFSNLESFRTKDSNLARLLQELGQLLIPPTKKLSKGRVNALPGYIGNIQERTTLL